VDGSSSLFLVLRVAMSLGMVLGIVGIALWVLKRRGPLRRGGAGGSRLEVVDRRPLSKGAHVALVRVGPEDFLVGVTDQQVHLLGRPRRAGTDTDAAEVAEVVVQLPAPEPVGGPAALATAPPPALPRGRRVSVVPTPARGAGAGATAPADGGAEHGATRWTGHARPARCAGQETRMGFVEALRELTVRRS
jgi:flagellar protein FliO/FliZ